MRGAGARAGAAAEAGPAGCVIYCALLQAQAGESWGWAAFRSRLPQAVLGSPRPLLGCPGVSGTDQEPSLSLYPSPGTFSVPLKRAHGCCEPAAGVGPGASFGAGGAMGDAFFSQDPFVPQIPLSPGIPSAPAACEGSVVPPSRQNTPAWTGRAGAGTGAAAGAAGTAALRAAGRPGPAGPGTSAVCGPWEGAASPRRTALCTSSSWFPPWFPVRFNSTLVFGVSASLLSQSLLLLGSGAGPVSQTRGVY